MLNLSQTMAVVRWALATAGPFLIQYGLSDSTVALIAGAVFSATPFIWGIVTHSDANTVAAANALPDVAGVITKPTSAGAALAAAVPANTVVPAGTTQAQAIAKQG